MSESNHSFQRSRPGWLLVIAVISLTILTLGVSGSSVAATSETTNVTVYRTSDSPPTNTQAIESAIQSGTVEPASEIVLGDILLIVIDSPRLADTMANSTGTSTQRFLRALEGPAELRIAETNPTPERNRIITSIGRENTTVYREGNRTYVFVQTGELNFEFRSVERDATIYGGERFAIEFGYDLEKLPLGGQYESEGPVVGFHPSASKFQEMGYSYKPLAPEWVQLSVNVEIAPDEYLLAQLTTENNRTIATEVETDDPPGIHKLWIDLRRVAPGTNYELELIQDGVVVDRYSGTVIKPQATLTNPNLTIVDGQTVLKVSVELSHGGKVQVLNENCATLGTEWVNPGSKQRLTIDLWTEDGEKLRVDPQSEYGVLVRSLRNRGASNPQYEGSEAQESINFNATCSPLKSRATPTSQRPNPATTSITERDTTTPTTSQSQDSTETPRTSAGKADNKDGMTSTSEQPGFGLVVTLLAIILLVMTKTKRP